MAGYDVVFRQPDRDSTADAYVQNVRSDLKTTKSDSLSNIKRQVTRKRRKQGPNFVLDISDSPLPLADVAGAMQNLCDEYPDDEIASMMIVDGAVVVLAGREVPEWRL